MLCRVAFEAAGPAARRQRRPGVVHAHVFRSAWCGDCEERVGARTR